MIWLPLIAQRIYTQLQGQPGLNSWFGELLTDFEYNQALEQATRYARQLQRTTITVVFFVEAVDDATRALYETPYQDATTSVTVEPVLVTMVDLCLTEKDSGNT